MSPEAASLLCIQDMYKSGRFLDLDGTDKSTLKSLIISAHECVQPIVEAFKNPVYNIGIIAAMLQTALRDVKRSS